MDPEEGGGLLIVAARLAPGVENGLALGVFEAGGGFGGVEQRLREVVGFQKPGGAQDSGTLDRILQLADVAGPVVVHQQAHGGGGDAVNRALGAGEEVGGQGRDIRPALAQGRGVERHHVEAVIEIFAEAAGLGLRGEVAVGGGDDAGVKLDGLAAAEPLKLALLQDAEELGLELWGEFADFVQEHSAAGGEFELAGLAVHSAREGAFLVAEEFAFEETFAEDGAVEGKKGPVGTAAGAMDRLGDDLLAGAAFAEEEDGGFRGGGALGEAEDAKPVGALADDAGELLAEDGVFGLERFEVELAFERHRGEGGEGAERFVVGGRAGVVEADGADAVAADDDGDGGDAVRGMEGDFGGAGAEFEADCGAAEELGEMALDDGVAPREEGAEEEDDGAGFEERRGTGGDFGFEDEAVGADGDVVAGVEFVVADAETVDEGAGGGAEIGKGAAGEGAVAPGDAGAIEDEGGIGIAADDGFRGNQGERLAGERAVDGEEAGGHGCQCIRINPTVNCVHPGVNLGRGGYVESTT